MFEELKQALVERGVDFEVVEGVFRDPTLTVFSRSGDQTTVQVMDGEIWIWGTGRSLTTAAMAAWTLSVIAAIC